MTAASDHRRRYLPSPIVGRAREQAVLRACLDRLTAGDGGLALVSGEAGIGKTTLVLELTELAREQGALVLTGGCYDLTTPAPYGPWLAVTASYSAAADLPALPAALRPGADIGDLPSQLALFEAFHAFFSAVSAVRPLVLLLEDLHWSDAASIDLLRFLARQLATARVLIVVTYRSDELQRDGSLFQTLPLLVRESRAQRLELRALHDVDVRVLASARYGLTPGDETRLVEHLQQRAEGNAFFLVEIMRALEETEIITQDGGRWALGDLERASTPPLLDQVIEGRLSRLSGATRDLLAPASVIGQEIPLDVWQEVSGVSDDALAESVEEAFNASLLRESPAAGGVRFTHALVQMVLYNDIVLVRRRQLHRRIAEALAMRESNDPDVVAHHFQVAGDPRAAEWLIRAGERAQRSFAWPIAAERFDAALSVLKGQQADPGEQGWLLFRIAKMRSPSDPVASIATLAEAIARGREAGDRLLVALARFDVGHFRTYIPQAHRGLTEMLEALTELESLPAADRERLAIFERDRVLFDVSDRRGTFALLLAAVGRHAEAIFWGDRVLEEQPGGIRTEADRSRVADAQGALALARAMFGLPHDAREYYATNRAANQTQSRADQVAAMALEELIVSTAPYQADRLTERQGALIEAEEAWSRMSPAFPDADRRFAWLPILVIRGAWSEAWSLGSRWREAGIPFWQFGAVFALGPLARDRGDTDIAWSIVNELLPEGLDAEAGDTVFILSVALQRLAAALALDAGDLTQARRWLEAHDRWLSWSESVLWQAEGQLLWGRFHLIEGDPARAYERAQAALARATEPRQPLALLAAHRFLGELDTAAGRYGDAEQHLQDALGLADACGAVFERALTALALAELRAATGNPDEARILAEEVRAVCAALGATPTLTRADALLARLAKQPAVARYPAGLTAREVEVLCLVAEGLTDAEVAERLFLATRTVNTHLTSIYTKLGVGSRVAATRYAIEHGLA